MSTTSVIGSFRSIWERIQGLYVSSDARNSSIKKELSQCYLDLHCLYADTEVRDDFDYCVEVLEADDSMSVMFHLPTFLRIRKDFDFWLYCQKETLRAVKLREDEAIAYSVRKAYRLEKGKALREAGIHGVSLHGLSWRSLRQMIRKKATGPSFKERMGSNSFAPLLPMVGRSILSTDGEDIASGEVATCHNLCFPSRWKAKRVSIPLEEMGFLGLLPEVARPARNVQLLARLRKLIAELRAKRTNSGGGTVNGPVPEAATVTASNLETESSSESLKDVFENEVNDRCVSTLWGDKPVDVAIDICHIDEMVFVGKDNICGMMVDIHVHHKCKVTIGSLVLTFPTFHEKLVKIIDNLKQTGGKTIQNLVSAEAKLKHYFTQGSFESDPDAAVSGDISMGGEKIALATGFWSGVAKAVGYNLVCSIWQWVDCVLHAQSIATKVNLAMDHILSSFEWMKSKVNFLGEILAKFKQQIAEIIGKISEKMPAILMTSQCGLLLLLVVGIICAVGLLNKLCQHFFPDFSVSLSTCLKLVVGALAVCGCWATANGMMNMSRKSKNAFICVIARFLGMGNFFCGRDREDDGSDSDPNQGVADTASGSATSMIGASAIVSLLSVFCYLTPYKAQQEIWFMTRWASSIKGAMDCYDRFSGVCESAAIWLLGKTGMFKDAESQAASIILATSGVCVEKWLKDVDDIEMESRFGIADLEVVLTRTRLLLDKGDIIKKSLLSNDYKSAFVLREKLKIAWKKLDEIHKDAQQAVDMSLEKPTPFCMFLTSIPGIGKSTVIRKFINAVMDELGEPRVGRVYPRNPGEKFWSGYLRQVAVLYDDFAQVVHMEGSDEAELIKICTKNPAIVPMAAVEEKGRTFRSKYVFACTNLGHENSEANIANEYAFRRRRHFYIGLDRVPGPMGPGGMNNLRFSELDRNRSDFGPALDNRKRPKNQQLTFGQAVALYVERAREHFELERKLSSDFCAATATGPLPSMVKGCFLTDSDVASSQPYEEGEARDEDICTCEVDDENEDEDQIPLFTQRMSEYVDAQKEGIPSNEQIERARKMNEIFINTTLAEEAVGSTALADVIAQHRERRGMEDSAMHVVTTSIANSVMKHISNQCGEMGIACPIGKSFWDVRTARDIGQALPGNYTTVSQSVAAAYRCSSNSVDLEDYLMMARLTDVVESEKGNVPIPMDPDLSRTFAGHNGYLNEMERRLLIEIARGYQRATKTKYELAKEWLSNGISCLKERYDQCPFWLRMALMILLLGSSAIVAIKICRVLSALCKKGVGYFMSALVCGKGLVGLATGESPQVTDKDEERARPKGIRKGRFSALATGIDNMKRIKGLQCLLYGQTKAGNSVSMAVVPTGPKSGLCCAHEIESFDLNFPVLLSCGKNQDVGRFVLGPDAITYHTFPNRTGGKFSPTHQIVRINFPRTAPSLPSGLNFEADAFSKSTTTRGWVVPNAQLLVPDVIREIVFSRSDEATTFYDSEGRALWTASSHFAVPGASVVGHCGRVLVVEKGNKAVIIGLGVADMSHYSGIDESYFCDIPNSLIEGHTNKNKALATGSGIQYSPLDKYTIMVDDSQPEQVSQMLTKVGTILSDYPRPLTKTNLEKSLIHDDLIAYFRQPKTEPTVLSRNDERLVVDYDPYVAGPRKFIKEAGPFSFEAGTLESEALEDIFLSWHDAEDGDLPTVLDWDMAINGKDGVDFAEGLVISTSEGYPSIIERGAGETGKTRYFEIENGKKMARPSVLETLLELERDLERDDPTVVQFVVACAKDEKTKIEKVRTEKVKTRVFEIMDFHFNIVMRKYFLSWMQFLMKNHNVLPCKVGTNPYSESWDKLFNDHARFENHFVGDYTGFDTSTPRTLVYAICGVVNRWCNDDKGKTRMNIVKRAVNRYMISGNTLYEVHGGTPSGFALTTMLNTVVNEFYLRFAWKLLMRKAGMEALSGRNFMKSSCVMAIYGDDNFVSVDSAVKEVFNLQSVSTALSDYGIQLGDGKKSGIITPFQEFKDIDFLKRGFREDKNSQHILCPLEKDSIEERLFWVARGDDPIGNIHVNAITALVESAFHGEEYFEYMYLLIIGSLKRCKIAPKIPFPSYSDVRAWWKTQRRAFTVRNPLATFIKTPDMILAEMSGRKKKLGAWSSVGAFTSNPPAGYLKVILDDNERLVWKRSDSQYIVPNCARSVNELRRNIEKLVKEKNVPIHFCSSNGDLALKWAIIWERMHGMKLDNIRYWAQFIQKNEMIQEVLSLAREIICDHDVTYVECDDDDWEIISKRFGNIYARTPMKGNDLCWPQITFDKNEPTELGPTIKVDIVVKCTLKHNNHRCDGHSETSLLRCKRANRILDGEKGYGKFALFQGKARSKMSLSDEPIVKCLMKINTIQNENCCA